MTESYDVLTSGGVFHSNINGFTPRIAQQEMAHAVDEALRYSGRLVVESGTGTGKTYAYLVPAMLSKKRTIISTGTKHLQEQIFYRDLPVVVELLGQTIKSVLLKGRSNYLCRYRLKQNIQQTDLIGKEDNLEYDSIEKWAIRTKTGDTAEVTDIPEDSPIWSRVTSTVDNCLGGKCPDYSKCFVNQARQNAMKADIVVVNHHLFFSDLTLKTEGFGELLPDHEAVIFDEAHSIPNTASKFFGFTVSSFQLKELIRDVLAAEKEEKSAADFSMAISKMEKNIDGFIKLCKEQNVTNEILNNLRNTKFDSILDQLIDSLDLLLNVLSVAASAGEGLAKCENRCLSFQNQLDAWRDNLDHDSVCWIEFNGFSFKLSMTPLNVGKHFARYLEDPSVAWIFTSATLAVGDDFSSFCNEIGLNDAETRRWDSPYDFPNNTILYLPKGLPDPRNFDFAEELTSTIRCVTSASRGRAFCLFTSHAMMNKVFQLIENDFEWPLFMQGRAAKQQLLDQFLQTDNSVLFGTSSFWEGVDVKGDALSCVIIDKLPFGSPADPVYKSKLQACEEQGGIPFMDIQIPNAVISLKQGAGRLIRSEVDRGVLVICDSRLTGKSYGKLFLNSLPPMPISNSFDDVQRFFE